MANTFKSYTNATAIGVTKTTLITVPAVTTTVVIGFKIANILTTGSITVKVAASGSEIGTDLVIPVGGVLEFLSGAKLVLATGELLELTASEALAARVHVSYMDIT